MELRRNWRRIAGGLAFLLAIAFLGSRACKSESVEAAIQFRLGAAGAEVRSLRAELYRGEDPEQLGFWQKSFDRRGAAAVVGPWRLRADEGVYRVEIEVATAAGSRRVTRRVELQDGATVTVDLTGEAPAAR